MFLGIIEESNSSIILKDDDGSEIKLALLKTPIDLDSLECIIEGQGSKINDDPIAKGRKCKTVKRRIKSESDEEPDMTLLKVPISLENLQEKNEKDVEFTVTRKIRKIKKKKKSKLQAKHMKLSNISLLKEPISLENVEWGTDSDVKSSISLNVTTVEGSYVRQPRRKTDTDEYRAWKQNASTIFEYSHVYPFIHAGSKFKCFVCSKLFLDASFLKEHTANDHSIKDLKKVLTNSVRDKNLKVDVSYLQCKLCLENFPNLLSLKLHLKNHDKKIDPDFKDNIIPFKLGGDTYDCQVCGESYLKLRLLIIHMSKHFNNYSCEICGSAFVSLNLLKRHLQIHEAGSFPCDKCDKVFSNAAKRTLHMRGVHLKQFPRRCPICPERFNSNYQRTKHLRIVHNQSTGLYRCETCSREYDLKYHLLIHIRSVHLQERNQECNVCHARFFSKYCLSRHMVIHTGEKNFRCDICGKAYARKRNLREHARSHELGLVSCSLCGRNCGDQANLLIHMNSAHGTM